MEKRTRASTRTRKLTSHYRNKAGTKKKIHNCVFLHFFHVSTFIVLSRYMQKWTWHKLLNFNKLWTTLNDTNCFFFFFSPHIWYTQTHTAVMFRYLMYSIWNGATQNACSYWNYLSQPRDKKHTGKLYENNDTAVDKQTNNITIYEFIKCHFLPWSD